MNRRDFQEIAGIRLREAKVLLNNGMYDGAYYLSGYAIECALKACIARRTKRHDFPPPRRLVERMYTHNLEELLAQADLRAELVDAIAMDAILGDNWAVVRGWSEESRYAKQDRSRAEALYSAVADKRHGVLRWSRRHW